MRSMEAIVRSMEMDEEEWMRLCLKAITANDPDTLTQVILGINRMLYLKRPETDSP